MTIAPFSRRGNSGKAGRHFFATAAAHAGLDFAAADAATLRREGCAEVTAKVLTLRRV